MAPVNNIERRAAKKLAASDGINYTEALRRIRNSGVSPSAVISGTSVVSPAHEETLVDKAYKAIMAQGGELLTNGFEMYELDLRERLVELLEPVQFKFLNHNVETALREGTPTGKAKAVSALARGIVRWSVDRGTSKEIDLQFVRKHISSSIIENWSLGNLLEELQVSEPIGGYQIDLDAEQGWTELSSRVEGAVRYIREPVTGGGVRVVGRGLAMLGLASLHSVKKSGGYNFSAGLLTEISNDQREEIERYGKEFVIWAGASDNAESIIRAAETSYSLDPEVLNLVIDSAEA